MNGQRKKYAPKKWKHKLIDKIKGKRFLCKINIHSWQRIKFEDAKENYDNQGEFLDWYWGCEYCGKNDDSWATISG